MKSLELKRFLRRSAAGRSACDMLAVKVNQSGVGSVMLTSRERSEGVTDVALGLACSLAEARHRVLLVDCGLARSRLTASYQKRTSEAQLLGLGQYLQEKCGREEIVYRTDVPNLWLVPAGIRVRQALPLFTSARFADMLRAFCQEYDFVLIDAPPVLVSAEALAIAATAEAALLVVRAGQGSRSGLAEAVSTLRRSDCRVLGAVLNGVDLSLPLNRRFYYRDARFAAGGPRENKPGSHAG